MLLLAGGLMVSRFALDGRPIRDSRAFLTGLAVGVAVGLVVLVVARRVLSHRGA